MPEQQFGLQRQDGLQSNIDLLYLHASPNRYKHMLDQEGEVGVTQ